MGLRGRVDGIRIRIERDRFNRPLRAVRKQLQFQVPFSHGPGIGNGEDIVEQGFGETLSPGTGVFNFPGQFQVDFF